MPQYTLMKHQKAGVKFLNENDGVAALLFEPGTGKTGTTLAWVDRMARAKAKRGEGEFKVLVVAPLSAADTWVLQPRLFMDSAVKARMLGGTTTQILAKFRKAKDWTAVPGEKIGTNHKGNPKHGGRVTILSVSAGAVSWFCKERTKTAMMLRAVRAYNPDLIVVDESHIIKSHNSNISKAMYSLGQLAPHRIILSGTVNPHSPLDCYGQWRFLAPWTFSDQYGEAYTQDPTNMTRSQMIAVKPWSWDRFRKRYAVLGGYGGNNVVGMDPFTVDELHSRVAERSMVVLKKDALDLPPVTDIDMPVVLSAREQRAYDEMRDELAAEMDNGEWVESANALAKIMKLRQIHAGFIKDTETDIVHHLGSSMRDRITDHVNVTLAGEDRVVVFAYFKSEVAALAKSLAAKGHVVETITGDTKRADRLAIRQRFGDRVAHPERTILVAQVTTMALSVNELVTACHAVYASMTERRADWVQSRDRLDRNGQTRPVTIWNFFTPGTIGEIMFENHKNRGSMEKALIDHIRNTPR